MLDTIPVTIDRRVTEMGKRREGGDDGAPSPIDVHVGARIRKRRMALGMSQEKLGDALKLTFQQIQKYERGANRVGASRLYELCRVFDVTADFFFEGLPNFEVGEGFHAFKKAWPSADVFAETQAPFGDESGPDRETAELVRAYARITDPRVRERVLDLVRSISLSGSSAGT